MSQLLHIVLLEQLWRVEDNPVLQAAYTADAETLVLVVLPEKPTSDEPTARHERHAMDRQLAVDVLADLHSRGASAAVVNENNIVAALEVFAERRPRVFREEDPLNLRPFRLPESAELKMLPLFTLLHPKDLPIKRERIPDLFKQFKKQIVPFALVRRPNPPPTVLTPASDDAAAVLSAFSEDLSAVESAPIDEQVEAFFAEKGGIARYHDQRQQVQAQTSGLAVALSRGALSPRALWWQSKRYEMRHGRSHGAEQLREQLLRRCFYRMLAVKHQADFLRSSGLLGIDIHWQYNDNHLSAWQQDRTGFPIVDAVMRELLHTGRLSNRARRIAANFLTRYLGQDWRLGASWFAQRLVDFDPYNTFGNWQVESGVGEDVRQFRFLDVEHQSERFDPDGRYIRQWLPELAALSAGNIHAPWALSDQRLSELKLLDSVYAKPIIDPETALRQNALRYKQALDRAGLKYPRSLVSRFVNKHDRKKPLR